MLLHGVLANWLSGLKRPRRKGGKMSPEYICWSQMRVRCRDRKNDHYSRYGGRGISVCPRWDKSFKAFLADMGPRPSRDHSLDRIDNDGNYEPGNCRWATREEQALNTSQVQVFEFAGQRLSITRWARRLGVSRTAMTRRLRLMSVADAMDLTKPAPGARRKLGVRRNRAA